jgi:hypothetical protein
MRQAESPKPGFAIFQLGAPVTFIDLGVHLTAVALVVVATTAAERLAPADGATTLN